MLVDRILCTTQFNKAIKTLKNKHEKEIVRDIYETVEKLSNFEITSQQDNHQLTNMNCVHDIHIRGNVVLLYRYVSNTIIITLELHNIVNHDKLNSNSQRKSLIGDASKEFKVESDIDS